MYHHRLKRVSIVTLISREFVHWVHAYYLVHVCDGFSMRILHHSTINLVVATLYNTDSELRLHNMLVAVIVVVYNGQFSQVC